MFSQLEMYITYTKIIHDINMVVNLLNISN